MLTAYTLKSPIGLHCGNQKPCINQNKLDVSIPGENNTLSDVNIHQTVVPANNVLYCMYAGSLYMPYHLSETQFV